jgi:hypothetical protein
VWDQEARVLALGAQWVAFDLAKWVGLVACDVGVVVDDVAILPRFLQLVVSEHVEFT